MIEARRASLQVAGDFKGCYKPWGPGAKLIEVNFILQVSTTKSV